MALSLDEIIYFKYKGLSSTKNASKKQLVYSNTVA